MTIEIDNLERFIAEDLVEYLNLDEKVAKELTQKFQTGAVHNGQGNTGGGFPYMSSQRVLDLLQHKTLKVNYGVTDEMINTFIVDKNIDGQHKPTEQQIKTLVTNQLARPLKQSELIHIKEYLDNIEQSNEFNHNQFKSDLKDYVNNTDLKESFIVPKKTKVKRK